MHLIPPFQQQCVRDLAWACFGPNLLQKINSLASGVTDFALELTEARLQRLQQLDRDPGPLEQHLENLSSSRLGLYFEALWHFFLQKDTQYELVAHNLPVHCKGKTLGEYDLIIYDRLNQSYRHLELAIKFYLQSSEIIGKTPDTSSIPDTLQYWLGPNTNDRLDLKLHRLLSHQSQLSTTDAGQAALTQLGLKTQDVESMQRSICVKGWLFYQTSSNTCIPEAATEQILSPNHQKGCWIHANKLQSFLKNSIHQHWKVLEKAVWISPAQVAPEAQNENEEETIFTSKQLQHYVTAYFQQHRRPILVVAMEHQAWELDEMVFKEQERFFITNDHWPR